MNETSENDGKEESNNDKQLSDRDTLKMKLDSILEKYGHRTDINIKIKSMGPYYHSLVNDECSKYFKSICRCYLTQNVKDEDLEFIMKVMENISELVAIDPNIEPAKNF